jgi:hypothetical protein
MIFTAPNSLTRMKFGASLANNDFATIDTLAVKKLNAKAFAYTITTVLRRAAAFTRCHEGLIPSVEVQKKCCFLFENQRLVIKSFQIGALSDIPL